MSETTSAAVVMSGTGQLMATAAAWGSYALLFSIAVFLVVKKGVRDSTPRQILLFATCFMFAASTALASVDAAIYLVQFSDGDYIPTANKLQLACEFLMGDTIVLWRTWTLLPDRRLLVVPPIALWFGGFRWTIGVYDAPTTLHLSMATAALSAATNFFSTLLISWKAWERRDLFSTQTHCGPGTRAHKIMSLLIESGFIYFGIWVIAMLNFYIDWKAPVLQAVLRGGYDMVMGTYPTLIIILVHLDYTFWDCNNPSGPGSTKVTLTTPSGSFSTLQPSMRSVLSPDKEKQSRQW